MRCFSTFSVLYFCFTFGCVSVEGVQFPVEQDANFCTALSCMDCVKDSQCFFAKLKSNILKCVAKSNFNPKLVRLSYRNEKECQRLNNKLMADQTTPAPITSIPVSISLPSSPPIHSDQTTPAPITSIPVSILLPSSPPIHSDQTTPAPITSIPVSISLPSSLPIQHNYSRPDLSFRQNFTQITENSEMNTPTTTEAEMTTESVQQATTIVQETRYLSQIEQDQTKEMTTNSPFLNFSAPSYSVIYPSFAKTDSELKKSATLISQEVVVEPEQKFNSSSTSPHAASNFSFPSTTGQTTDTSNVTRNGRLVSNMEKILIPNPGVPNSVKFPISFHSVSINETDTDQLVPDENTKIPELANISLDCNDWKPSIKTQLELTACRLLSLSTRESLPLHTKFFRFAMANPMLNRGKYCIKLIFQKKYC